MRTTTSGALVLALLVAACPPKPAPGPLTPEEVLAQGTVGKSFFVRGTVFAISFDNIHNPQMDPNNGYTPKGDRYVLIRTVIPPGVQNGPDLEFDAAALLRAWSLGLFFDQASLANDTLSLPQIGDVVEVTGTFAMVPWDNSMRPVLSNLSGFRVVTGKPALAKLGEACHVDLDCRDELACSRTTHTCVTLPATSWGDSWHDVNGACVTDSDCPAAQICDLTYTMSATDQYPPYYNAGVDIGKHLCIPDPGLTQAQICPRTVTSADLASGRFALGKEICVTGDILLTTIPTDGDTHTQMVVTEPLVLPVGDAAYYLFGATNENTPPYKNSSRMGGAIVDPKIDDTVMTLGTFRYDPGHGWFELHPIKKEWKVNGP
jgi:hypothetical protein